MTVNRKSPSLLIHACCGPCLIAPLEFFDNEGFEIAAHFYNPNIHPLIEFRRRLKAVKVLQETVPIKIYFDEQYGLRDYLENVDWRVSSRCRQCYEMRLNATAALAASEGYDFFTTTMICSMNQDHEALKAAGEQAAEASGVDFIYRDLRHMADKAHKVASKKGLYLQSYCGCVFSEYERYKGTKLHIYKGPGGTGQAK